MRLAWRLVGLMLLGCLPVVASSMAPSPAVTSSLVDRQASQAIEEYLLALDAQQRQEPPALVIDRLTRAIQQNPQVSTLYYQRARLHASTKAWPLALQDAERAVALEPTRIANHLLYTDLLNATGRAAEAVTHLQKLLQQRPRAARIYQRLARLYLQQQQYSQTEALMRRLLRVHPDSIAARVTLGQLYAGPLRRAGAAVAMYREAARLAPGRVSVNLSLAELYLDQRKPREALQVLLRLEERGASDVAIQLRIAMLYYELRNYSEAIRRMESVLVSHPQADKLRYYLGVLYEESGNLSAATMTFALVPPASELYKDAQLRLAVALSKADKVPEAIALLQQAIARRKNIAPFYEYLAALQEQRNDTAGALKTLQAAAQQFPLQSSFLFSAALAHDRLQQHGAAVRLMQRVLVLEPKNVTALNYVGFMYADWGRRLDEAETLLQKAVQLQPNDGHILDSLAWVYFKKKDYEHALQLIELAQRLSPDEPAVLRHYAQILRALDDEESARRWLQRAKVLLEQRGDASEADELKLVEKLLRVGDAK